MASFSESVKANVEKVKRENQRKCYSIMNTLFNGIVYDTPVLNGYLINNWFTTPNKSFSMATSPLADKRGGGSLLNIQSLDNDNLFYGRDSAATMVNNLNYAINAEYLGWARTPPYAMVRLNLTKVAGASK